MHLRHDQRGQRGESSGCRRQRGPDSREARRGRAMRGDDLQRRECAGCGDQPDQAEVAVGANRARGEDALIEYNNRPKALSLRSENDQLLKELGWIDNYAPEFFEYVQDPTSAPPPNTKKSIGWAKIRFGLKPVILLTEVITYTKNSSIDGDYLLSVTKQIYANHYVGSSVGLIVLLRDLESGPSDSSRLLYVNHSRASALRGMFGKFMRKIVQREVMEKFNILLQNTANVAEHDGIGQDVDPPARTMLQRAGAWISEQPFLIALLILIVALITVNRFNRPITK
jgi:hypothetical protein